MPKILEGMEPDAVEALRQRFAAKFTVDPSGCWLWTASTDRRGYGKIAVRPGRLVGAHRVSLVLHRDEDPAEAHVCHTCDVPRCVNPAHLWLCSARENVHDMHAKGRGVVPEPVGRLKTACVAGHPYTPENTYRDRHGKRSCKACRAARNREWFAARRAA